MERDIKNKTIVVTGGAGDIGFQITRKFLKAEAKLVILLDINEEKGNEAVEKLTQEFGLNKAMYIKCNVVEDLEPTYQQICDKFGIIDVLVNSAGIVDENIFSNCVNINLTATINWSLKFMELMRKDVSGNGGTILNIASIFGYRITHFTPVYNATSFGVVGFTKTLGHEIRYNKKKVRVIALCPGFTKTNFTKCIKNINIEVFEELKSNYQWQSAEEVGEKAVEIFKIADSGTLWEIEGGVLREVK